MDGLFCPGLLLHSCNWSPLGTDLEVGILLRAAPMVCLQKGPLKSSLAFRSWTFGLKCIFPSVWVLAQFSDIIGFLRFIEHEIYQSHVKRFRRFVDHSTNKFVSRSQKNASVCGQQCA